MPDAFDWDDAWENPADCDPDYDNATCKRCGRSGFCWTLIMVNDEQVWRLVTPTGKMHMCGRTASLNEFPIVE